MGIGHRRIGAGLGRGVRGGGGAPSLASRITAAYAAVGWACPAVFIGYPADLTLAGSAITTWLNRGTGGDATQGTAGNRPTYSATAINSRPGMTLDGGDFLATPSIDLTGYTAYALSVLFSDTIATVQVAAQHDISTGLRFGIFVNDGAAGDVTALHNTTAGVIGSRVRSAASFAMATPAVVTATGDRALATNEGEIRHAGVNVTNTRVTNSNSADGFGNAPLYIGATQTGASGINGALGACVLAVGTTAVPVSTVALVEALLASEYGL